MTVYKGRRKSTLGQAATRIAACPFRFQALRPTPNTSGGCCGLQVKSDLRPSFLTLNSEGCSEALGFPLRKGLAIPKAILASCHPTQLQ